MVLSLAQLKSMKKVKATRVNGEFMDNEDIIQNFEKQCKEQGYNIVEKKLNKDNMYIMEYVLLNPDEVDTRKVFIGKENINNPEYIKGIVDKQTRKVLSYYTDEEFLYMEVQGKELLYDVRLNKDYMKREQEGLIKFRSKDYVFCFTSDNGEEHEIYGDYIKAEQYNKEENTISLNYGIKYILAV